MTSPSVERALELVGKLFDNAMDFDDEPAAEQCAADLRSAIRAIGASEWRTLETAPKIKRVRVLVRVTTGREVMNAWQDSDGVWWTDSDDFDSHNVLAWKPADSTELPAELEGK